ncbi:type I-E CRISPR-associated protein Cas6/Cse3/CasE [Nocardia sp. NPDC055321]
MSTPLVTCHSILQLNARHPESQRALLDAQAMHRLVMVGFLGWVEEGERDARAQMGVLHTSNIDLRRHILTVVVQSRVPPDWSRLDTRQLIDKPAILNIDQKVETGQRYRFRVVVNPVRMSGRHVPRGESAAPRGELKRLADNTPAHARRWFVDRLQPVGESPVDERGVRRIGAIAVPDRLDVRILPKLSHVGGKPGLRIGRAEVRGELEVTDPEVLVDAIIGGIGRAKAYGCGLLLMKPIGADES